MTSQPLVSVVVILYKQEKLVEHTLASIAAQSYANLELIVSDDASPDGSLKVVRAWAAAQASRFSRLEIIESSSNQGIAANLSQGLEQARGEFIKIIASDDLLEPSCIEAFMKRARSNDRCIWFGKMSLIDDEGRLLEGSIPSAEEAPYFSLSSEQQFRLLQIRNWAPAPSSFFSRALADELQMFRDGFRLVEDWPTWMKATKAGCALRLIPETVVRYRKHQGSTYRSLSLLTRIGYRVDLLRTHGDLGWHSVALNLVQTAAGKVRKRLAFRP